MHQYAESQHLIALDIPEGADGVLIFIKSAAADTGLHNGLGNGVRSTGFQIFFGLADLDENLGKHASLHNIEFGSLSRHGYVPLRKSFVFVW